MDTQITKQNVLPVSASQSVTIGDALVWYGHADGIVRASALREVINQMIHNNVKTDFENDSYLDALVLTEIMFERCERSVKLFTGAGCEDFLKALSASFTSALERLKSAGVGKIQVIILSDKKPEFLADLEARYKGTLEVALAMAKEAIGHFFVCDGKMARVEKPHGVLLKNTPVNAIQAKVHFNNTIVGNILDTRFDVYWDIVSPKPKTTVKR